MAFDPGAKDEYEQPRVIDLGTLEEMTTGGNNPGPDSGGPNQQS
jgi:hypothetical protein